MIYLDSNIFVYPILYKDRKAKKCEKILLDIANGNLKACTSFLSWDELVWIVSKYLGKKVGTKKGEEFLRFPNLLLKEIDIKIMIKAQEIFNSLELDPRDAIHLATALKSEAKEYITLDKDFLSVKNIINVRLIK